MSMMNRLAAIALVLLSIGALSEVAAVRGAQAQGAELRQPVWRAIAWPFPRDAWPEGRAFRCDANICSATVDIYVRPKVGFCNCDTGVADDDEVDRVADLDLISERFAPKQAGGVVHVAGMSGRARDYDLDMPDGTRRSATGIALSHRCDLLVAVVQSDGEAPELQQTALTFLESEGMQHWIMVALGGG